MEFETYIRFIVALVFVLALIGLLTWLVRHFGVGGRSGSRNRGKSRIGVVELAPVDAKRRLVLVRRDSQEHLILLGVNSELLVESGFTPPGGAATTAEVDQEDRS
ncbi:MAG: FliO/MopB family protein [Proteobacteria bacterium]|nr:FliO/MopB family protein [Pseudomonadota bacterium]